MNKKTGMAVNTVSTFNGKEAEADRNGLMPVYLTPVAGFIPNRNVIAGTVAKNSGLEDGKTYLAKWTRVEDDPEYGPQFNFTKISEMSAMEVITSLQALGDGQIFDAGAINSSVPQGADVSEQEN